MRDQVPGFLWGMATAAGMIWGVGLLANAFHQRVTSSVVEQQKEEINAGPLEGLVLQHVERAEKDPNFFNNPEELVYPDSLDELKAVLEHDFVFLKEGTHDCMPCRAQSPMFESMSDSYSRILESHEIYEPKTLGFFEADLGTLVGSQFMKNKITEGDFVPVYSLWERGEDGIFTAQPLWVGSLSGADSAISEAMPGLKRIYPWEEESGESALDLARGVYSADHFPELDSVSILHWLATQPDRVSYVPRKGTDDGFFRIDYGWQDNKEWNLLLRSRSWQTGEERLLGSFDVYKLSRMLFANGGEKGFNPKNEEGGGVRVNIDDYDLREGLERFVEIPENLIELQEGNLLRWDVSYPTFDPGRILESGELAENIVELDENTYSVIKGTMDLSDLFNIVGDRIQYYGPMIGMSVEEMLELRGKVYRMQWDVYSGFVSEEHRELVADHFDGFRRYEGFSLPSRDELDLTLKGISGRELFTFDKDAELLREQRDKLEAVLESAEESDIGLYEPNYNSEVLLEEAKEGNSLYVGVSFASARDLTDVIRFMEEVRERYGDVIRLGIVDIPNRFGDLLPYDIGAGTGVLRDAMPRSGDPSGTYMFYRNGCATDFGTLPRDMDRRISTSFEDEDSNIYKALESLNIDGNW